MKYFKHFSDMRHDPKIRRLISKYGLEGYGLYNLIIESIAGSVETNNPLPFLEESCEDIADFYNANSSKVDEMVRFMIQQGLLSIETVDKRIACFKIYKYFEQSQTRSEQIRNLIESFKNESELLALPDLSETNMKNRIEQNRKEEEEKPKKPRAKADKPLRFQADFDEYWNSYPPTKNKVSKSTAYKAYIKKRDEGVTREDLLAALEIYKQECKGYSDTKYIRCPHRTIEQYTPPIQPKKEEEPVLKRFEHHVMAQIRKRDDGEDYDSALIDLYMDRDSDEAMEVYAKKWAETGDWR